MRMSWVVARVFWMVARWLKKHLFNILALAKSACLVLFSVLSFWLCSMFCFVFLLHSGKSV